MPYIKQMTKITVGEKSCLHWYLYKYVSLKKPKYYIVRLLCIHNGQIYVQSISLFKDSLLILLTTTIYLETQNQLSCGTHTFPYCQQASSVRVISLSKIAPCTVPMHCLVSLDARRLCCSSERKYILGSPFSGISYSVVGPEFAVNEQQHRLSQTDFNRGKH